MSDEPIDEEHREDLAVAGRIVAALQRNDDIGVLIGWVVIAEYAQLDGERVLRKRTGDANAQELKSWHEQGYLHAALHTSWGDEEDDE